MDGFAPSASGAFLQLDGPARGRGERPCRKKLCLVATDQALLRDTLLDLARDPDCYFVKYSARAKDGMYLGRCFLTDPARVGALWARLKKDPRLMCTVQDDDFVEPFRASST